MSHRGFKFLLGTTVLLTTIAGQAHAQWGYGYYPYGYGGYGWGGWGATTLQGDVARGLGYFNMGAGIYNRETAVANSINTDTAMRWNEYVYESQKQGTREYLERRNAETARDKDAFNNLMTRIRDNPTAADVQSGDALNAALDQLSDPRIHSSVLRSAEQEVTASSIREIPFRNASEAITFSLAQIRASSKWPAVLMEERFKTEKAEFEAAVDQIRKEVREDQTIPPDQIEKLRNAIASLRTKLTVAPLEDNAENKAALNFLKTVTALARMLEKPDIDQVLGELSKIEKTSLGNLLGFMQTFNLRFGPATTAKQRAVYEELFPIIDQTRDKILGEAKLDAPPADAPNAAAPETKSSHNDFFSAMDLDHLSGGKKTPRPPAPAPEPKRAQP